MSNIDSENFERYARLVQNDDEAYIKTLSAEEETELQKNKAETKKPPTSSAPSLPSQGAVPPFLVFPTPPVPTSSSSSAHHSHKEQDKMKPLRTPGKHRLPVIVTTGSNKSLQRNNPTKEYLSSPAAAPMLTDASTNDLPPKRKDDDKKVDETKEKLVELVNRQARELLELKNRNDVLETRNIAQNRSIEDLKNAIAQEKTNVEEFKSKMAKQREQELKTKCEEVASTVIFEKCVSEIYRNCYVYIAQTVHEEMQRKDKENETKANETQATFNKALCVSAKWMDESLQLTDELERETREKAALEARLPKMQEALEYYGKQNTRLVEEKANCFAQHEKTKQELANTNEKMAILVINNNKSLAKAKEEKDCLIKAAKQANQSYEEQILALREENANLKQNCTTKDTAIAILENEKLDLLQETETLKQRVSQLENEQLISCISAPPPPSPAVVVFEEEHRNDQHLDTLMMSVDEEEHSGHQNEKEEAEKQEKRGGDDEQQGPIGIGTSQFQATRNNIEEKMFVLEEEIRKIREVWLPQQNRGNNNNSNKLAKAKKRTPLHLPSSSPKPRTRGFKRQMVGDDDDDDDSKSNISDKSSISSNSSSSNSRDSSQSSRSSSKGEEKIATKRKKGKKGKKANKKVDRKIAKKKRKTIGEDEKKDIAKEQLAFLQKTICGKVPGVTNKDKQCRKCRVCNKKLSSKQYLMMHIQSQHLSAETLPVEELKCTVCKRFYSTMSNLNAHVRQYHPNASTNKNNKNND